LLGIDLGLSDVLLLSFELSFSARPLLGFTLGFDDGFATTVKLLLSTVRGMLLGFALGFDAGWILGELLMGLKLWFDIRTLEIAVGSPLNTELGSLLRFEFNLAGWWVLGALV
jgi:hypothetical protein